MRQSLHRALILVLLGVSLLAGCAQPPGKSSSSEPVSEPKRVPPNATVSVNAALDSAQQKRDQRVTRWLEAADRALEEDRLMTPLGDNAYDRYQAVLLVEPNNVRARTGLQAITLRYLELARSAMQKGQLTQAETMLERAAEVDADNPLLARVRESLQEARRQLRQSPPLEGSDKVYEINPYHLSQRAPELVKELQRVARKVREQEVFVLIVSRTDEEGRWIYQQMRDAVPGYLLRGNIHLGSPPRLELKPLGGSS